MDNLKPDKLNLLKHPTKETCYYRYILASQFCRDSDVLDAACGYGYGSHILRTFANNVTGLDIDRTALDYNRKKYPYINFKHQDITKPNKELENKFDVVVSIETFEHLPRHMINTYLQNLRSWVKEGGTIFMTTPQRRSVLWNKDPENSHMYEYSPDEFGNILRYNFPGSNLALMGIDEVLMGKMGQLVSILNQNMRESRIMVGIVESVKK